MKRLICSFLISCAAAATAVADWKTDSQTNAETGVETSTTVVSSADGYRFTIGPGGGKSALCEFALPEGAADDLNPQLLPTLSIDGGGGFGVALWERDVDPYDDGGDFMEAMRRETRSEPLIGGSAKRIRFKCWTALLGQSTPATGLLRQIMGGEQLVIRYDTAEDDSVEVVFVIEGAKEAIAAVLDVPLEPTDKDFLPEDLLRFRIEYRAKTCFLLAGKKNRNRCLEAVNRCAQQVQESVVSNMGCIEVK